MQRYVQAGIALLSVLPALWVAAAVPSFGPASFRGNIQDAMLFRTAARLTLAGESPYDPSRVRSYISTHFMAGRATPDVIPFAYPPVALPFLFVHALGSPRQGLLCAVLAYGLALACALMLAARSFGAGALEAGVIAAIAGCSGVVYLNAMLGQTGPLIAAIVLAYLGHSRTRPRAAGLALALSWIKPQYAPFLWLVAAFEGQRRVLLTAAISSCAGAALVTALWGAGRWSEWWSALRRPNPTLPFMGNWLGAFSQLNLGSDASLQAIAPLIMGCGLVSAALWLWATRTLGADTLGDRARIAVVLALATLVSPNTHPYDLAIGFAPALLLPGPKWLTALGGAVFSWAALPFELRPLFPALSLALAIAGSCVAVRELRRSRNRDRRQGDPC